MTPPLQDQDVSVERDHAQFGDRDVAYASIQDVIINEDTTTADGIGAAIVIREALRNQYSKTTGLPKFATFSVVVDENAIEKVHKFAEILRGQDIPVRITRVLHSAFDRVFMR